MGKNLNQLCDPVFEELAKGRSPYYYYKPPATGKSFMLFRAYPNSVHAPNVKMIAMDFCIDRAKKVKPGLMDGDKCTVPKKEVGIVI